MEAIVIVGGGIAGLSLAHHLRDASADVTVLEKDALGSGTTGKSVAVFDRYIHTHPVGQEIVRRSWNVYGSFIERGVASFRQTGFMQVADTEEHFGEIKEHARELESIGVTAEILTPEETAEHDIEPAGVGAGAIFAPDIGRLDPGELVAQLADEARQDGVEIETGVEVTDIVTSNGRVVGVETDSGALDSDIVVNAAGPWAIELNEMVGETFPLRHTYAPILALERDPNPNLPVVIFENGYYFLPDTPGRILAGHSPQEESGRLFYEEDGVIADPDGSLTISEAFRLGLADMTSTVVPVLADADMASSWMCLRCVTPDRHPLVGETRVGGFYLLAGMSGAGITRSPGVAEVLAEHLLKGADGQVWNRLDPYRFAESEAVSQ